MGALSVIKRGLVNAATYTLECLDSRWVDGTHPYWSKVLGVAEGGVVRTVNHQTALQNAAYWKGLNKIVDAVGRVPLHVLRNLDEGGSEKDKTHPAYGLLRYRANAYMSAGTWKKTTLFHAIHWGNGISLIERNRATAAPVAIKPLLPGEIFQAVVDGELFYVGYKDGVSLKIRSEDVFHIMGLSMDGLWGLPFMDYARVAIGVGNAARTFTSKFFDEGFNASGLLHVPDGMFENDEEEKEFFESLKKQAAGLGNSHKFLALPEGMKFERTTVEPEKAEMVDTMNISDRDVANFLKLPPSAVGLPGAVSYNSLEQSRQDELDSAVDPWLCSFEDEAREKCLTERQKRETSHKVEFKREALLRVDFATRREQIRKDVNEGLLTENEGREAINMPGLGPEGERRRIPVNITYTDQIGKEPEPLPALPAPMTELDVTENTGPNHRQVVACSRMIQDASWRAFRKASSRIVALARKSNTLCAFVDGDFDDELVGDLVGHMAPSCAVAEAIFDFQVDTARHATTWLNGVKLRLTPKLDEWPVDEASEKAKEFMAAECNQAADFAYQLLREMADGRNLPV